LLTPELVDEDDEADSADEAELNPEVAVGEKAAWREKDQIPESRKTMPTTAARVLTTLMAVRTWESLLREIGVTGLVCSVWAATGATRISAGSVKERGS
jgi:hypothetical protein